jgi:dienelactone hydrolase
VYVAFPDNYGWSLSTMLAIGMGGEVGEIEEICAPLRPLAAAGGRPPEEAWLQSWRRMAERLARLASADESAGHTISAARKWQRTATYYLIAERHVDHKSARKLDTYHRALEAFERHATLSDVPVEFVDVPYQQTALPALFVPAISDDPQPPCMIHFDGLDVTKEIIYLLHGYDLRRRGVSLLIVDQPGVGGALRLRDLRTSHDTEVPAGACIDYLEHRSDVDPHRIGLMALSMGGYYAPRAASFEKRLACCVAWGAIWDLEACLVNCIRESTESVSFEYQLGWVFGIEDRDALWNEIRKFTLDGIADQIKCPLLIVHGENDRQAPVWTAHRTYEAAVNSRRRELKIFTLDEGGAEHCHCDNITIGVDYMHDWIADVLVRDTQLAATPAAGV